MSELKFNKTSKALITATIILSVACFVSVITMLLRGIRDDIFAKNEKSPSTIVKLAQTSDYGQYYVDSMVFVGDSTIAGMINAGVLKDGTDTDQVWTGESGDLPLDYNIDTATVVCSKDGKILPIAGAIEQLEPEYIVITLGINNGVPYCTEESFKSYYQKLITSIKDTSPNARIILQSVLPVSEKYAKNTSGVSADKIDTANEWISELAELNQARYLDTASALKNSKGYLDGRYDSGNGLCLNADGYRTVLNYIRTHGYK
ncbi:MAG: hypothetical protein E7592_03250 [Ruminococcaceae bacterium]|nr:hypothetical protein [Oscillospiraceae bacterium]